MNSSPLRRLLTAAFVLTAGVAAGDPKTPLGIWMQNNMGNQRASEDYDALKTSFKLVATKPPSGAYAEWASISAQGAAASAKQDRVGIKKACDSCHNKYKDRYVKEFPKRPFP